MFVTVVIPVGPAHGAAGVFQEAVASADAQTLPVKVIVQHDEQGRGASWARNAAMRRVKTPFVVFLDADDLLHPQFVEQTVTRWKPGHYVYTDYAVNGQRRDTPDKLDIWRAGQEHITPTLLPVAAWRAVGGFDEQLDTLEDEDFYTKLHAFGWCGIRCPQMLIDYRRSKGNSRVNADRHDWDRVTQRIAEKKALFTERYQAYMACGCKENAPKLPAPPQGQQAANTVLVKALYSPMTKTGPVTGRKYPRTGLGRPLWVDKDDAEAKPEWWQKIADHPVTSSPDIQQVRQLVAEARAAVVPPETKSAPKPEPQAAKSTAKTKRTPRKRTPRKKAAPSAQSA